MQGYIVENGVDPFPEQFSEHVLAIDLGRQQDVVHVAVVLAFRRNHRAPQQAPGFQGLQQFMVMIPGLDAAPGDFAGIFELRQQEGGCQFPRRNDEPISCQVYLSASPRKKRVRSVPFSRMISARAIRDASFTSSAPPSPEITFFVS